MAGEYSTCPNCRRYGRMPHECPPMFLVHFDEWHGDDSSDKVFAHDTEAAAQQWGESYDGNGDYTIVGGENIVVSVTDEQGLKEYFRISGEVVREYTATKI
jgi:hypothetical protein